MKKLIYPSLIIALLFLISCTETETKTITSTSIEMSDDYLMEGSNTVTGVWIVDLEDVRIDKVESAKVKSVNIEMQQPDNSTIVSGVIMQLAASGTSMQRVGVLNPVPEEQKVFQLTIAEKQENLVDLLKQEEITFVADINLSEEPTSGFLIKTTVEFELEVKQ